MAATFGAQDLALLEKHIQALVEVEFFTIPVYLTGVYSFTQKALNYQANGQSPLYDLQQKALSVAVQEMYHLELACNLANVFQVTPQIPTTIAFVPGKTLVVPHLDPKGTPLDLQLGNLPAMIEAMIEIELHAAEYTGISQDVMYTSIGNLYHATLDLLHQFVTTVLLKAGADPGTFKPNYRQVAYATFANTYRYNAIKIATQVIKVVNAVVDQGEGHEIVQQLNKRLVAQQAQFLLFHTAEADNQVAPEFRPAPGSRFAAYGDWPHHQRFTDIQAALAAQDWAKVIGGDVFYQPNGQVSGDLPAWAKAIGLQAFQASIGPIWSYLIDVMQLGFTNGKLNPATTKGRTATGPGFNDVMLSFKYLLPILWQWGACPSFTYQAGVTPAQIQKVMDKVDPLCLFHWDAATQAIRADSSKPKNACQGLNQCKGLGWGGIATQKANGACATADLHTCGGNNNCGGEAGCGYLVSTKGEACSSSALLDLAASPATADGAPRKLGNLCGPPKPAGEELLLPSEEWIPGRNECKSRGGCQTPISPKQIFSNTEKTRDLLNSQQGPGWNEEAKTMLTGLMDQNVWDRARDLFAQREGYGSKDKLPTPISEQSGDIDYDGDKRRQQIPPTT